MTTTTLAKGFSTVIRTIFMNRAQTHLISMKNGTALPVFGALCPVRQEIADHRQIRIHQQYRDTFRV